MDVEKVVLACRVEGATLVDVLMAAGAARRTRRWLCDLLLLLQRARPYEVLVPLLKRKLAIGTHISATLSDEEQLRCQFEQF